MSKKITFKSQKKNNLYSENHSTYFSGSMLLNESEALRFWTVQFAGNRPGSIHWSCLLSYKGHPAAFTLVTGPWRIYPCLAICVCVRMRKRESVATYVPGKKVCCNQWITGSRQQSSHTQKAISPRPQETHWLVLGPFLFRLQWASILMMLLRCWRSAPGLQSLPFAWSKAETSELSLSRCNVFARCH